MPARSLLKLVPPGSIFSFGSGSATPPGYLLCDGSSYSDQDYPELFSVIRYTYGGSSGFFNVPDTRDRFVRGTSDTRSAGRTEEDKIRIHTHDFQSSENKAVNDDFNTIGYDLAQQTSGNYIKNVNTSKISLGFDNANPEMASEMRPENMTLQFVIKY